MIIQRNLGVFLLLSMLLIVFNIVYAEAADYVYDDNISGSAIEVYDLSDNQAETVNVDTNTALGSVNVEANTVLGSSTVCSTFKYGESELGRELICYSIKPLEYDRTILMNFAIHGFEDEYDHDSTVLTDTAMELIEYYSGIDDLNNCQLLIIPCANPDGQIEGTTNNGFGRCNALGIDLNRDFDANYSPNSNARYYTEYAFSAAESRALRDLCLEYEPDIVLDFHGWLNYTIGDSELAEVFYAEMGLKHHVSFTSTNASGYFANWAHQNGAYGLLVEFTSSDSISIDGLKNAVNRLINNDFDNGTGKYKTDSVYSKYDNINCYTISLDRVTTYADINIPFNTVSYIDGSSDLCTIKKVYENGWVKVEYPVSSGKKTAYAYLSDFIDSPIAHYNTNVSANQTVYRRMDLSETLGTVYPTDEITVVGRSGETVQVLYPLDNGGYKLGWISSELVSGKTVDSKMGDVNGDGNVDFIDAGLVLQYDVGLCELSGEQLKNADINADGLVDFMDVSKILCIDVGM